MNTPERCIATALALAAPLPELRTRSRRRGGPPARRRQALFEFLRLRSHARHAAAIALRASVDVPDVGIIRAAQHLRETMNRMLEFDRETRWDPERVASQVVDEFLVRNLAPAVEDLRELALVKPLHPLTLSWEERLDVEDLLLDRLAARLVWQEAPLLFGDDAWASFIAGALDGGSVRRGRFQGSYADAVGTYRSIDTAFENALPGAAREGFDLIRLDFYRRHFPPPSSVADPGQAAWGPLLSVDDLPWGAGSGRFVF